MEKLHQQRVEKLREEGATVLEFKHDEPVKAADVDQALKLAKLALVTRQELKALDDEAGRKEVINREPILETFRETHPMIFQQMTCLETGARSYEVLLGLGTYEKSNGDLPMALRRARVSEFILHKVKT
jgi:hypothetical protein